MIRGMDIFREYFGQYQEQYVLIGGAACDMAFDTFGAPFRATKDLDMVLIAEALTPTFGRRFWDFIRDGGYENRAKSNGAPQFYRFDKPKDNSFPYMIELFARQENLLREELVCVPLHIGDDLSSLSAVLLNADYYDMLHHGKETISGIVVLSPLYLIPFKAKAWLELSDKKASGLHVDEHDIKKHRNDVVRLATILTGTDRPVLPASVQADMRTFLASLEADPVEPKSLKLGDLVRSEDILDTLRRIYL